jgi:hypothetical protein
MSRKICTVESFMMINGLTGTSFYSEKKDKDLTAIASYYKRKITTERIIALSKNQNSPISKLITKVTLL